MISYTLKYALVYSTPLHSSDSIKSSLLRKESSFLDNDDLIEFDSICNATNRTKFLNIALNLCFSFQQFLLASYYWTPTQPIPSAVVLVTSAVAMVIDSPPRNSTRFSQGSVLGSLGWINNIFNFDHLAQNSGVNPVWNLGGVVEPGQKISIS